MTPRTQCMPVCEQSEHPNPNGSSARESVDRWIVRVAMERLRLLALFALCSTACAGEALEVETQRCTPEVVLRNPGPSVGCMRAFAGEGTTVRIVGDDGPGSSYVDIHAGEAYEALSCHPLADVGSPWIEACSMPAVAAHDRID